MRKAVRYTNRAGVVRIGSQIGEEIIDAAPDGMRGFDASDQAWDEVEAASGPRYALDEVKLLAPTLPGKVLCIGSNYRDHIVESGLVLPEHPVVFTKLTSAIIGPGDPIIVPFDEPQTDWEAELALIIGRRARRATGTDALSAIGGITAFNDVSGRHAQLVTGMGQYTRGKSFDTFGPLGPVVVHPDDVDINSLNISLAVSGKTMQSSNTSQLLFDPRYLIEWLSAASTLLPGDVIATGTPGGVGHALNPPRYLQHGDYVEVTIQSVGTLRNPVIMEQASRHAG
jgi:2-keto-4-pentenoate hydratase/2-oxohepta-3-ene-1,7-dioic acid hydratase in catechol pathway